MKSLMVLAVLLLCLSCRHTVKTVHEENELPKEVQVIDTLENKVSPINNAIGYNDTLGISLRPEYSVYSTETEKIHFILYNNSGKRIVCGKAYYITYQDEKGVWRKLPINDAFEDIGFIVPNAGSRFVEAFLCSNLHVNQPGKYRFYYQVSAITLKAEFRLSNNKQELKQAVKCMPFFMSPGLTNQNIKENVEEEQDSIFYFVDEMPEFPGGMGELIKFIKDNTKYPSIARKDGIEGRVIVQAVIDKDGSMINCCIIRGIDPYLDKEAIRIAKLMPKWKPGKRDGKAEIVKVNFPVTFRLPDNSLN